MIQHAKASDARVSYHSQSSGLLAVGDRIPPWPSDLKFTRPLKVDEFVGKIVVLFFVETLSCEMPVRIRDCYDKFKELDVSVLGITNCPLHKMAETYDSQLPFPVLNPGDHFLRQFDDRITPMRLYILDANQRIIGIVESGNPGEAVNCIQAYLSKQSSGIDFAPVLKIPRVLDEEICHDLISYAEREWDQEGRIELMDLNQKIRSDRFLQAGREAAILQKLFYTRVRPEILKAFHFDATYFENPRIACYDSNSTAYLRPHRDNTTSDTVHRRFTLSLNLNSEEYEGGLINFPEYGHTTYKLETGSGLVFSSSLLHRVTEVTQGRRFVLLTFFYGENEARFRK